MAPPDPRSPSPVTPETIARMAGEIVKIPVKDKDHRAVADLLQSLAADMTGLRRLHVGEAEPAFVYDAAEVDS